MQTNLERLQSDLETISKFNSTPGKGCTRFTYSKEDKEARNFLIREMKKLDLEVWEDAVGNIRARMEGQNPNASPVMIGSHIDTVLHGGNYDGIAGVIVALESVRVLKENEKIPAIPIEIMVFAEEEGSNFGFPIAGSKAITGSLDVDDLKNIKNDQGISMYEMAKKAGYNPDLLYEHQIKPGDYKAMLELHIEQSVVLDSENISIGIVESVAGVRWYSIEIEGVANHAGATPMNLRQDPMVGASELIASIDSILKSHAYETTVCTFGKIDCIPNVPNIIPGKVLITTDIRDVKADGMEIVSQKIYEKLTEIAEKHDINVSMNLQSQGDSIELSSEIINTIENAAIESGMTYKKMNSGAVHDACLMTKVTDVGMIFVPSVNGRSHVPEEKTEIEDLKKGADLFLSSVWKLANEK